MFGNLFQGLLLWSKDLLLPLGAWGLFILSFIEAIFFPIPPDVFLVIFVFSNSASAWIYVLSATVASVLGAIMAVLGFVDGLGAAIV